MKVLHAIHSLEGGGAETQLRILHRSLLDYGIDSNVVCFNAGSFADEPKVLVVPSKGKFDFSAYKALGSVIADIWPDVIHTWLPAAITIPSMFFARRYRIPAIFSYRNKMFFHRPISYPEYVTALVCCRKIVSNNLISQSSPFFRWLFRRKNGEVIYNSISFGQSRQEDEIRKKQVYKILFAGRLTRQKNLEILIKALEGMASDSRWILQVCGVGELENELRLKVTAAGIQDRVIFEGFESNLSARMLASDLLIFPSNYEGMPNVLLEALAARLPVIASDIPASRDVVGDTDAVQWFSLTDAIGLRNKIIDFFDDPVSHRPLSESGLQLSKGYSKEAMTASYIKVYELFV